MSKKLLVNITIICALLTQVSHASQVYYLISDKSDLQYWMSWVFAISLELSIYIFTMSGERNTAIFFSFISCGVNLISYWFDLGWTQKFLAMILISPIIPITIYFYSELIKKQEKDEPKRKRRRRNAETGELEDVEEEN
jgi:hypothetical protein